MFTKTAPPSAKSLEFKSPKTRCGRAISVISTSGIIVLPAIAITIVLAGLFYNLNLYFPLAWEADSRTLVTSLDSTCFCSTTPLGFINNFGVGAAFWMTCLLGIFYLLATPVRFWRRSQYRKYPWHFTIYITGGIALVHYGHILMMLLTVNEFGTTLSDVVHFCIFLGTELALTVAIVATLRPLKYWTNPISFIIQTLTNLYLDCRRVTSERSEQKKSSMSRKRMRTRCSFLNLLHPKSHWLDAHQCQTPYQKSQSDKC